MNIQRLQRRLGRLQDEWEANLISPDVQGRIGLDWIKGVCYGISLAIREVRTEIEEDRKPRSVK